MTDHRADGAGCDAQGQALDRLLQAAMKRRPATRTRPQDSSIEAYLSGSATVPQRNEVQKELLHSAEFRQELLGLAKDLHRLEEPDSQERFNAVTVGSIPSRKDFMERLGSGICHREGTCQLRDQPGRVPHLQTILASTIGFFRLRPIAWRLLGATAVAGLTLVIMSRVDISREIGEAPAPSGHPVADSDRALDVDSASRLSQSAAGPVRSGLGAPVRQSQAVRAPEADRAASAPVIIDREASHREDVGVHQEELPGPAVRPADHGSEVRRPISVPVAAERLPRVAFEPTRGYEAQGDVQQEPTAWEAAARVFMREIQLTEGQFRFVPPQMPDDAEASGRVVRVELLVGGRETRETISLRVPGEATEVKVWLLGIPSLQLYVSDVMDDAIGVMIPESADDRWCATVTCQVDSGYAATEAVAVAGWQ